MGANFVHHWCAPYPRDRVVMLDALTYAGNVASLAALPRDANVRFVKADIGDEATVLDVLHAEPIDARKARRELGRVPHETFETGLGRTVDWYLTHEPWWRDVLSGAYRTREWRAPEPSREAIGDGPALRRDA